MNKSESIKNLAIALAKFQGEIRNPSNTATNPYFKSKYAPLDTILNTVRPILSSNGLSIIQAPSGDGENIIVTTILLHNSGEWMESPDLVLKADKATAQGAGSAITYARRYALSAILGISSEDDDDGNNAEPEKSTNNQKPTLQTENKQADNPKQDIIDNSLATDAQITYITNLMKKKEYEDKAMIEYIKKSYKKDDLKALTKAEAGELINMLNGM